VTGVPASTAAIALLGQTPDEVLAPIAPGRRLEPGLDKAVRVCFGLHVGTYGNEWEGKQWQMEE
jgi:hypothetical protein